MKLSGVMILPGLVAHPEQQLVVQARLVALQRPDRLPVQVEAALLERGVDARRPLHLAAAAHQVDVVLLEAVDAVAALLLGGLAGAVGGRQHRGHVLVLRRDRHDADAGAEAEGALLPR